jgi:hypothetical protein
MSDLPYDLEHDHISNYEVSDDYAEKYLRTRQAHDELSADQMARALNLLYNAARVSPALREAVQTVERGVERLQRQLRAASKEADDA